MRPIIAPPNMMNPPNKVIKSPMSLVTSKKIPPTPIIISPILIGYWGLNFNSFLISGFFYANRFRSNVQFL